MKKWLVGFIAILCMMFGAVAWAKPQIPPIPTESIYVQDYAGVLSDETKTQINRLGSTIAKQTKAQVVVVTLKSLDGRSIQDYSLTLLRQWQIGDRSLNNGVLLLVSVGDKASRIEVGYGLEGALNDAKVGRIQDEYLIPFLARGEYDQGIGNAYKAVMREISTEYGLALPQDNRAAAKEKPADPQSWWEGIPWWLQITGLAGMGILLLLDWVFLGGRVTIFLLYLLRLRGRGGGGGGYGGGSSGGGGSDRKW